MRRLAAEGATTFIEVGPGSVLCGLGKKIVRDARFVHVETPDDLAALAAALA
jgi:[acyl-carrier-protein] S-malonyltransferase